MGSRRKSNGTKARGLGGIKSRDRKRWDAFNSHIREILK
ncbi:hypothetical protein D1AOALGA4SA_8427 [Olavius algarvensis Delta 1 endosymbiont]|nr:hypothetical protein D1AOALGA4SA_8427 [Olavius algarvensis Delta 1 endosymbiont]